MGVKNVTDQRTDGRTDKEFLGVGCNGWEFQKWPVVVHFWLINWEEKKTEMRKKIVKKSKNFDEKYITVVEKTKKISKTSQTNPKKISTNPKIITNKSNKYNQQILLLHLHAQMQKFLSQKKQISKIQQILSTKPEKSLSSSSSHCSYHSIIYIRARGGRGKC